MQNTSETALTRDVCPTSSPWGPVQHSTKIADGIYSISTAGHGGIYVSDANLIQMPYCLSRDTFSGPGWFEEDCDWAFVVLAFPHLFTDYEVFSAVETAMGWKNGKWHEFVMTEAGRLLWLRFDTYKTEHAAWFRMGASSTSGKGWHHTAISFDGKERLDWREDDDSLPPLSPPFCLADVQHRAVGGANGVRINRD